MSVLEIKQGIARLSRKDRREVELFLLRLKHSSPEWKRDAARKVRDYKAGKALPLEKVEHLLRGRG